MTSPSFPFGEINCIRAAYGFTRKRNKIAPDILNTQCAKAVLLASFDCPIDASTAVIVVPILSPRRIGIAPASPMKLVPEKTSVTEIAMGQPMYLDTKLISQPVAAMQLVAKETLRCADIVEEMFVNLHECIDKNGKNIENELEESAQTLQKLYVSINDYLASMYSEGVLTEEQASQSAGVLYVLCDIDRIGILLNEIVNTISVENKSKHKYSKDALKELRKAMAQIHEIYTASIRAISGDGSMDIEALQKQKDEVMALDERLRKNHITRVGKGKCDSKLTAQYNEMLHNIDRIGNSCVNLVEVANDNVTMQSFFIDDDDNGEVRIA